MSKRTTFTSISPLPPDMTREVVVQFLHNHQEMIDLNPLVIERHLIPPPPHAPDEERPCVWWSMTDKISYLPGGMVSGDITYTAAFNDLPNGIQTHVYAPMGTDIRERWTLNGTLPGEPLEPVELGLGAPVQGLYLREDIELRCNFMMTTFVKKTLKKAHSTLVERMCQKARAATRSTPGVDGSSHRAAAASHANANMNTLGDSSSGHSGAGSEKSRYGTSVAPASHPSQHGSPYEQQQQRAGSAPYMQDSRHPSSTTTDNPVPAPLRLRNSSQQQHSPGYRASSSGGSGAPQIPPMAGLGPRQGDGNMGMPNGWSSPSANGIQYVYDPHAPGQRPAGTGNNGGFAAELE